MAPLAIVQNNTDVKEKGLQLFYVNNQDNLGVSLKNSADEGQDPLSFFEAASDAYTGIIPVKSEIGSAVLNGLNLVVAITKHKPKDQCEKPTVNDISIVSPVYKVLDQTNITNTTATIISNKDGNKGGNSAWAYYLRGSDPGNVAIVEYEVTTGNKKSVAHLNVDPDCSLAAFYDTANKGRSVIYQDNAEAQLVEYRVNSKQPIFIEDSGGAMPNTSLAVAYYEGYAYLYYTDKFMNLFRIVKDKAGNWGSHKKLGAETNPDPSSQFTAIGANGVIHLFYQATDNPNITHYRDQPIVEK